VLSPLGEALWQQIVLSKYMQADETRVKILKPDKKGFMWVYQGLDPGNRFVMLEFDLTRAASVPDNRLKDFTGLLQTDGYSGYVNLGKKSGVIHLGCWDHARRKFVDADKVCAAKGSGMAAQFITLINKLYKIEREIKDASYEKRYQARQEKSKPLMDKFKVWLNKMYPTVLPQSPLGKAINYCIKLWPGLTRFLEDGRLEADNNLTEQEIKPLVIARKNFLFASSVDGAHALCMHLGLIRTAKRHGLDPYHYYVKLLKSIPHCKSIEDYEKLLPWNIKLDYARAA
jgi:transposase